MQAEERHANHEQETCGGVREVNAESTGRTSVNSAGDSRRDGAPLVHAHADEVHSQADEERADVVPPQVPDDHSVDQDDSDDCHAQTACIG